MLATEPKAVSTTSADVQTPQKAESPRRSLADLVNLIRKDAKQDSVHYLLRTNTSHDGE